MSIILDTWLLNILFTSGWCPVCIHHNLFKQVSMDICFGDPNAAANNCGYTSVHIQNYMPKNTFLEVNCWGTGKCIGNLSVCLAKFCSMGLISVF